MKSFFEDLGKKIGETTETVTSKAGEMMEIQRLRGQIRTLERGNEADMLEMGRFMYEKYRAGEEMDEQVQMLCEKIDNRTESIERHQAKIKEIKGTSTCAECGKQVAKEMAYCPYCGAKKEEDIWDETEDVLREKADQAVEFVKEKTTQAMDTVAEKTEDAAEVVVEKTEDAAEAACEHVKDLSEAVKEKAEDAAEKIKEFTEE